MRKIEVTAKLRPDYLLALDFSESPSFRNVLNYFKDKALEISIKPFEKKRSDAQNRYMWGVVVPCVRQWFKDTKGEKLTEDEIYTWLRMSLLEEKPVIKIIDNKEYVMMTGKRFSQMSTAEFSEAIEIIIAKMAEVDCQIPYPKEQNHLNFFLND